MSGEDHVDMVTGLKISRGPVDEIVQDPQVPGYRPAKVAGTGSFPVELSYARHFKSKHAVKQTIKMAPRDAHFENQIEIHRRERRLLVARNINFESTRADFETDVRTKLTMGDSVTFFWPRPAERRYRHNKKRHQGYTFLAFETKEDAQLAQKDLQAYSFSGRRVNIIIASKEAFVSGSGHAREAARTATAPSVAAPTITASAAAAPTTATITTPAPSTTAAPAPAAPAAATEAQDDEID
ncbi:hypothetical protein TARUN_8933 [Trichoderma arundinaceum]|uniref:RRM domain-containing protein n=1 Tax=Trichoderma arundinaceum TaxID=490622 RepID=A0A395NB54_TRIAR|nr:hypothetical protein TARUN_8933 [Trichoderma arundinaceum]